MNSKSLSAQVKRALKNLAEDNWALSSVMKECKQRAMTICLPILSATSANVVQFPHTKSLGDELKTFVSARTTFHKAVLQ
jgi:hypothetical protein